MILIALNVGHPTYTYMSCLPVRPPALRFPKGKTRYRT